MRSRLLLNVCLALVLAGLAYYVVYRPHEPQQVTSSRLVTVDRKAVNTIEVEKYKEFVLKLEKRSDTWFVNAPFRARANSDTVDLILDISEATSSSSISSTNDAEYGFDAPTYRLNLNDQTIIFGKVNELINEQYVRTMSDTFLLRTHFGYNLPYTPEKIVSEKILGPEEHPISFDFGDWQATKTNGEWKVSGATNLSSREIEIWASGWRITSAINVETSRKNNESSPRVMKIGFEDGTKVSFTFIQHDQGFSIDRSDEDIRYNVGTESGTRLLNPNEVAKTL